MLRARERVYVQEREFEKRRQRCAANEVDDDPGLVHRARCRRFTVRDAARGDVSFIQVSLEGQGRVGRRATKRRSLAAS